MLDQERMPRHVAIIMDGNGRWAKNRGLPRLAGHNAGMKAMKKIVDHSDKLGIRYLTVYAFSTENWKRSLAEVSGIFKLLVTYVNSDLKGLIENNVKVQVLFISMFSTQISWPFYRLRKKMLTRKYASKPFRLGLPSLINFTN